LESTPSSSVPILDGNASSSNLISNSNACPFDNGSAQASMAVRVPLGAAMPAEFGRIFFVFSWQRGSPAKILTSNWLGYF
jgi:hypothetical protein